MDDEDLGFDGPDIRPPQASKGSNQGVSRSFGSGRSDRDRKQGYNSNYSSNSHQRGSGHRNNPGGNSRDRQGGHRHGNAPMSYGSGGPRGGQNVHSRDRMADRHDRKGDLRDRLHQRREGPGNVDPNRHRDRDHRNKGDLRRSGSGSGNNRNVTLQNTKQSNYPRHDKISSNRHASKDEELRRKRQQMEEEAHRMEDKVRRKRERSKDRDRSKHPNHGYEKSYRSGSDHSRNKKSKKSGDMLQAVDDAIAEANADPRKSGEEDISSDENNGSGGSDGSMQTSSSEEGSGSENEDSGSGSDQEGSEQDTASEPGSQHTTPDNVSGEELEHGEIASRGDRNDVNKTEMEEGEAISADEDSKTQPESREGSYSGQDGGEKTSDKRSRQKKKHKRKNRSEDEMDQVAHGRWGKNEESDVSDAPITDNSDSETDSRSDSRSDRSRTPSRSPTPRRDLDDRSQSQASFADGIEAGTLDEEKHESTTKEDPRDKLPPYLPSVYGCRSVEEFQCLNRIEEGTYGVVYRARDKKTNEIVALKRLKMEREKEGFPITSLREINTLLISQHRNVVTVREIVVGSNMDKIFIVMDFVEHDLKSLMETMRKKKQVFLAGEVKCLMIQLLSAISHLHDNWILHRDLKSSNLLLSHNGILKVGDFGLAREYGSPLQSYTAIVVTLWYRAPELLLGIKEYSTAIDVWSCGCIFGELLLMNPLFPGESEVDELNKIFKLLGTPNEKIWPGYNKLPAPQKMKFIEYPYSTLKQKFPKDLLSELGMDLMKRFLTYDPKQRITCDEALKADYFKESPTAIDPSMFPTWPAKSEMAAGANGGAKKAASPKPPSGGGAFKKINDEDEMDSKVAGFALRGNALGLPQPANASWNLKF